MREGNHTTVTFSTWEFGRTRYKRNIFLQTYDEISGREPDKLTTLTYEYKKEFIRKESLRDIYEKNSTFMDDVINSAGMVANIPVACACASALASFIKIFVDPFVKNCLKRSDDEGHYEFVKVKESMVEEMID